MARNFRCEDNKIFVFGDTFPVKEHIKSMGGRWQKEKNCWVISQSSPETLNLLERLGFLALAQNVEAPKDLSKDVFIQNNTLITHRMTAEDGWRVSQFLDFVESILFQNLKSSYWVVGEISSLRLSNGHLFFDLADKKDEPNTLQNLRAVSLSCVLWQGRQQILAEKIKDIPWQDGVQIKVCIGINLRKEGARLSGVVEDVDADFTQGNLLLQRQQVVRTLKQRGLYDLNRQKQLPPLPLCIALITAAGSRAATDFLHELSLSGLAFQLYIFDCHMQGQNTASDVCRAFQKVDELKGKIDFDCVVLTRGGGSRLDLRWFDDFEIAKSIAHCPLPVICAVGHFEDNSVADEVAFLSEKTPTGAARFLTETALRSLHRVFSFIEGLTPRLMARFEKEKKSLDALEKNMENILTHRFRREAERLASLEKTIRVFVSSLEYALKRGYALVKDPQGTILRGDKLGDILNENSTSAGFPEKKNDTPLILEMWSQKNSKRVLFSVTLNSVKEWTEEES